ncbi:dephospho-CoA kinase [Cetobacterium sp. SF1]|uniref:dephospho-CoA kinase n=1 Tax=Cetobacterium sp. SF1 TaxID=3417654 RepID=UPI003CF1471D
MIIGLTGGIASGKSTVSDIFKNLGIKVYDGDIIAKNIMAKEEVILELKKNFGKDIFDNEGRLNRKKFKEIVFNNKEKLEILNGIVHPKVIKEFYNIKKETNTKDIVLFDVPLLFETGIDKLCDRVIVVDIDENIQIERIIARDEITIELAKKIIEKQMDRKIKISKADYIIENNGTKEELYNKALDIYREIKKEES